MSGIQIFISYAHEDEHHRKELVKHLEPLRREGLVEVWHDRMINAGSPLDETIKTNLQSSQVVLLLISPDFIASEYCYDMELETALRMNNEGKTTVIPVIVRPCNWHSLAFGHLMATPTDGRAITKFKNVDEAYLEIEQAVRQVAKSLKEHQKIASNSSLNSSRPSNSATTNGDTHASSARRIRREFTDLEKNSNSPQNGFAWYVIRQREFGSRKRSFLDEFATI